MYCSGCGIQSPDYFGYCPNDGQPLVPKKMAFRIAGREFCGACGHKSAGADQYCQSCGHHLADVTPKPRKEKSIHHPVASLKSRSFPKPKIEFAGLFSVVNLRQTAIATVVAIFLLLIVALGFRTVIEGELVDLLRADGMDVTAQELRDLSIIEKTVWESDEVKIDLPNPHFLSLIMLSLHNVTMNFSFSEDGPAYMLSGQSSHFLFLIIPGFILAVAGSVIGFLARRSGSSVWQPVILMAVVYAVFLTANAILAGFNYTETIDSPWSTTMISVDLSYSVFSAFALGLLLPLLISGIAANWAKHGLAYREVFRKKHPLLQYLHSAWIILVFTVPVMALTVYLSIDWGIIPELDGLAAVSETLKLITGVLISTQMVTFAHLVPLEFSVGTYLFSTLEGTLAVTGPSIDQIGLISAGYPELANFSGSAGLIPIWMRLAFIVPGLFILYAGYRLFETHQLKAKNIFVFSAIYGLILVALGICSSYSIHLYGDGVSVDAGVRQSSIFLTLLIGMAFSAIFFTAGGLVKQLLRKYLS